MRNAFLAFTVIHYESPQEKCTMRITGSMIAGLLAVAVIVAILPSHSAAEDDSPARPLCLAHAKSPISSKTPGWRKLTLRQKIGQAMIMLPNRKLELQLGGGSLGKYFERYPVSGYFMGWKLFDGVADSQKTAHIRKAVREYQAASRLPLLFQEDYEHGVNLPGMTPMPMLMSVGAANSEELAYAYGKHNAKEAWSVGVRWVLNPIVDLTLNPMDPLISTRAIGDDPERAVRLLTRQIAGIQENGAAACAKTFPGDGADSRDQHLCTTCNPLSMPDWRQTYGTVFQAAIDAGVMSIMPGHFTLPAYQKPKNEYLNGFHPPATLSRALLTDLLKGEMGFKGVIVSDAMLMGGFRGYYDNELEGEIQSFLAGMDVLLWPSYEFMDEVEARIKRGQIPMSRLDDAVSRVWEMKRKLGLLNPEPLLVRDMTSAEKAEAQADSRRITERSLTLVRDRKHALPLDPVKDKKILLLAIVPRSRKGGDGGFCRLEHMKRDLESHGFLVDLQRDLLYETDYWQTDLHKRYDRIIVIPIRQSHQPFGPLLFWDDEAQSVWGVNAMPTHNIILVTMGSPRLVNEYFERVDTCINAYSYDESTQNAVVLALLGEIPFKGSSPVSLERPMFVPGR
jgi:beta-N-acetylhexosaminidase